jgi:hypothetical protein
MRVRRCSMSGWRCFLLQRKSPMMTEADFLVCVTVHLEKIFCYYIYVFLLHFSCPVLSMKL